MVDVSSNSNINFKGDSSNLQEALNKINEQIEKLVKSSESVNKQFLLFSAKGVKAIKGVGDSLASSTKEAAILNKTLQGFKGAAESIEKTGLAAKGLAKATGEAGKFAGTAFAAYSAFGDVQTYFSIAKTAVNGLTDAVGSLYGIANKLPMLFTLMESQGFSTVPIQQFGQLTDAITGSQAATQEFTTNAISAFTSFQASLTQVNTILKANREDMEQAGKDIQALVNGPLRNAVSSIEALSGQYEVLSGGFTDQAESQQVLAAGLKLSTVGYAESGEVLRLLVKTMQAYGFESNRAMQTAAELNGIVEAGITTIPELTTSFGQTATVAKQAGVSIDELGGAVALLTTQGRSTPTSLTGIEALLRNVISKTPEAEKALADLSAQAGKTIKLDVQSIRDKGLVQVLRELNEAAAGNASILADVIPDSLAFGTALALMAENGDKYAASVEQLGNASASGLQSSFEGVIEDPAAKMEAVINRFNELMIEFGRMLAPTLDGALDTIEALANAFNAIPEPIKKFIAQFITVKLAADQVVGGFTSLITSTASIVVQITLMRQANMLMNGEFFRQAAIIKDLIKEQQGYGAVLRQIIGLDQTRLLVNKENLKVYAQDKTSKKIDELAGAFERLQKVQDPELLQKGLQGLQEQSGKALDKFKANAKDLGADEAEILANKYNDVAAKINEAYGEGTIKKLQLVDDAQKAQVVTTEAVSAATTKEAVATRINVGEKLKDIAVSVKQSATAKAKAVIDAFSITSIRAQIAARKQAVVTYTLEGAASAKSIKQFTLENAARIKNQVISLLANKTRSASARAAQIESVSQTASTVQINVNTVAKTANTAASSILATTQAVLGKVAGLAAVGFNFLTTAIAQATTAMFAFLANPIVASLVAIAAAAGLVFAAFKSADSIKQYSTSMDEVIYKNKDANESFVALAEGIDVEKFDAAGRSIESMGTQFSTALQEIYGAPEATAKFVGELTDAFLFLQGDNALEKGVDAITSPIQLLGQGFKGIKVGWESVTEVFKANAFAEFEQKADNIANAIFPELIEGAGKMADGFYLTDEANRKVAEGIALTGDDLEAHKAEYDRIQQSVSDYVGGMQAALEAEKNPERRQAIAQRIEEMNRYSDSLKENYDLSVKYAQVQGILLRNLQANNAGAGNSIRDAISFQIEDARKNLFGGVTTSTGEQVERQVDATGKEMDGVFERLQEGVLENWDELEAAVSTNTELITQGVQEEVLSTEEGIKRLNELRNTLVTQKGEDGIEASPLNVQLRKQISEMEEQLRAEDLQKRQDSRDIELSQIRNLEAARVLSAQEAQDQIYEINIKSTEDRINLLRADIAERKESGRAYRQLEVELQKELLNLESQRISQEEELRERAIKKQLQQADNQLNELKNKFKEQMNEMELSVQALQQNQKVDDSNNSVIRAEEELAQSRLSNELRLTGDVQKRAQIEREMAEQKLQSLAREQEAEQRSLAVQNQINAVQMQREVIQNRIAQAENQRAILQAQIELQKAARERKPAEELAAIELQIAALNQQTGFLAEQGTFLDQAVVQQQQIAENSERELSIRQQIAREGAEIDVELAQRREVAAQYEKQREQINLIVQEQQFAFDQETRRQDAITKSYENQNKILEARKSVIDAQNNAAQSELSILSELANTDRDRKKLAEEAAEQKLRALLQSQAIERQSLEIQLAQNEAAQKRAEIENQIQQIKNQADIAAAQADLAKVQADPTSTQEQVRAAELQVQTRVEEGAGIAFAGELIRSQAGLNAQLAEAQRFNLETNQQSAVDSARLEVANSSNTISERQRRRNDLRQDIEERDTRSGPQFNFETPEINYDKVRQQFLNRQTEFNVPIQQQSNVGSAFSTDPSKLQIAQPGNTQPSQLAQISPNLAIVDAQAETSSRVSEAINGNEFSEVEKLIVLGEAQRVILEDIKGYSAGLVDIFERIYRGETPVRAETDNQQPVINPVVERDLVKAEVSTLATSQRASQQQSNSSQVAAAQSVGDINMTNEINITIDSGENPRDRVRQEVEDGANSALYNVLNRLQQLKRGS